MYICHVNLLIQFTMSKAKQSANVSNVETKQIESANVSLVRKHKIDYSTLSQSEQKKLREKRRKGLFNIIDKYILSKKGKNSVDEKTLFEEFKAYVLNNYNIPLSECESVFSGTSANVRSEYWKIFIPAFKKYLSGK